jgi:hypothetical protein
MAIPEHVRKQAMDAVSHRETTAQIRAYRDSGVTASPSFTPVMPVDNAKAGYQPITPEIRKQAMDAVAHKETTAQIRLVKDSGTITPPHTPSRKTTMMAERVAELHKSGQSVDAIQQKMTKDNFGREHEIG